MDGREIRVELRRLGDVVFRRNVVRALGPRRWVNKGRRNGDENEWVRSFNSGAETVPLPSLTRVRCTLNEGCD